MKKAAFIILLAMLVGYVQPRSWSAIIINGSSQLLTLETAGYYEVFFKQEDIPFVTYSSTLGAIREGHGLAFAKNGFQDNNGNCFLVMLGVALSVDELNKLLEPCHGTSVVIVSAAHSGVFIQEKTKMPNRVIITSTSIESPGHEMLGYEWVLDFDRCLLVNLLSGDSDWHETFDRTEHCVVSYEFPRMLPPSDPQVFVGPAASPKIP